MLDPEYEKKIQDVAADLACRRGWIDHDELASEAWLLVATTDVTARATTPGAFGHFIKDDLRNGLETEARHRQAERSIDAYQDGGLDLVMTESGHAKVARRQNEPTTLHDGLRGTSDEDAVAGREWTAKAGLGEDNRPRHVPGDRSRLLDRLVALTRDEFIEWAKDHLPKTAKGVAQPSKVMDLEALLNGSSREVALLWEKYVRGKRVEGVPHSDENEARVELGVEEWNARYRGVGDARSHGIHVHPLVVSEDGAHWTVATMLRSRSG